MIIARPEGGITTAFSNWRSFTLKGSFGKEWLIENALRFTPDSHAVAAPTSGTSR